VGLAGYDVHRIKLISCTEAIYICALFMLIKLFYEIFGDFTEMRSNNNWHSECPHTYAFTRIPPPAPPVMAQIGVKYLNICMLVKNRPDNFFSQIIDPYPFVKKTAINIFWENLICFCAESVTRKNIFWNKVVDLSGS
jgi:hypothetical protein